MYKTNTHLQAVPGDTPISRYMDFISFYSFLRNKTLYFRRLDKYTDKLEGQIFEETIEEFKADISAKDPGIGFNRLQDMADHHVTSIKSHLCRTLSNSWNIGSDENYAMWKIYLRGSTEGVAVRTTTAKLIKELDRIANVEFYSGKVYYETIHNNDTNQFRVSTTKRKAYTYENEYRFLMVNQFEYGQPDVPKFADGTAAKIDILQIIDQIYISPFASTWFRSVVKELITDMLPGFDHDKIIASAIQDT